MNNTLLRTGLAIALAALAGPAAALGLGQIQVKSQPGQPLLAEIPIISNDPSELQGLQVQLAAPETFRRVGLEPPQGDVSSLRFEPALDAAGHPVIRVTSPQPVQQPLLTFLVEVDWGQGRLVREYSALIDAPRTVAAPAQPPIEAPVVAPPNTIVREPEAAPAPAPASEPSPAVAATPTPVAPAPPPPPAAIPLPPPPAPEPVVAAPAPAPAAAPASEYEVRRGDTLAGIAAGLDAAQGHSLDQAMLALLRANPEAFIGGNINRLKQGAVLRLPQPDDVARQDAAAASAVVREQVAQWREARQPALQPAAVASAEPARTGTDTAKPSRPAVAAGARLEIVPPSPGRKARAGTQSGFEAGGEGDMLRQQLQETKETLAARDAEVGELKARVAELEKLQQQQQQLLTLKDSELANAQRNLAQANRAPAPAPAVAQPVAAAHQAAQQAAAPAPAPERGQASVWLWGGAALVVVALLAWLLARRKRVVAVAPARVFDTAALAASIPGAMRDEPVAEDLFAGEDEEPYVEVGADADVDAAYVEDLPLEADVPAEPAATAHWTRSPAAIGTVPTWHGGNAATAVATPASPAEQLERARAYLDLGDDDSARALLREVLDSRDPAARATAARMLREL